ncbi:MAG: hypothetical protein ACREFI_14505 [Stellaceae bacterium]
MDKLGEHSRFGCVRCGGRWWEIVDGGAPRYRCRIGHAETGDDNRARVQRSGLSLSRWFEARV